MARDYGVEEWLPGGIAHRVPAPAPVTGAEFTLDGAVAEAPSRLRHDPDQAAIDLNAVDFDGLVGLGISVGQAARFISQRERRGGISHLSELDRFYGLAPGVRDILRWNGRV